MSDTVKPWRCGSCGARGGDGGWVAGREHLDVCPERAEAEVRGFRRAWALFGKTREVAWTQLSGWTMNDWHYFPDETR